jgi:hypothetical protein
VVTTIAWLVGASVLTSAAAWWPSSFFPAAWTTVVVLATMEFAGGLGDRLRRRAKAATMLGVSPLVPA